MSFKVSFDLSQLQVFSEKIEGRVREAVDQVASEAIALMRLRVQRGINANDGPMDPYSPEYAKWRKSKGRQVNVRDLLFTGRMLGDLHVMRVEKNSKGWNATIGFASARGRNLAQIHQIRDNFFGFSPSDVKVIERLLKRKLAERET